MINLLEKLGLVKSEKKKSKNVAKERLQFILVQDRIKLSPGEMDSLKRDLIKVIQRYIDIDEDKIDMEVSRQEEVMAMVANFQIKRSG